MYALGAYLKWYEFILRVGMIKFVKRRIIQALQLFQKPRAQGVGQKKKKLVTSVWAYSDCRANLQRRKFLKITIIPGSML